MLPFLERAQNYNAINFNWGCEDCTAVICYKINSTGTNAQIKEFVCPSDPQAGVPDHNNTTNTNSYYACVGTSTWWGLQGNVAPYASLNVTNINMASTGMFTYQATYGIQACVDGTSNTIAYSEACVGNQTEQPRGKLIGLQGVTIPFTYGSGITSYSWAPTQNLSCTTCPNPVATLVDNHKAVVGTPSSVPETRRSPPAP